MKKLIRKVRTYKKMKALIYIPIVAMLVSSVASNNAFSQTKAVQSSLPATNPFFAKSKLPFQAPNFRNIKISDFKPAMEQGMKEKLVEIEKVANNPAPATFANTLLPLEKSGQLLSRASHVFNLLTGANTSPELQKIEEEEAPKLAASNDAMYLNTKLFKRISSVYEKRDQLNLDPESKRLVEYYYEQFELAGAKLSEAEKEKLKTLNKEEASLTTKFTSQLLAATKAGAVVISDKAELAGLSEGQIASAAQNASANGMTGKWLLSLQNTTQQPLLGSMSNRKARQKVFEASVNRAEKSDANDTRTGILRLAKLRAEKASLLGFKNYAAWKLKDQMAQTPEAVAQFMAQLVPAATAKAEQESDDIQAVIDQQSGGFKLEPWDWEYYAEQVRKAKYDLDEAEVKPYLELDNVLQKGVFYAANQLYGLTFKERKDLPVYQEDVRVFDVFDKDGSQIALFYCDYFKRDNKAGGAWMSNLVEQSKLMGSKPVIYNVCNFSKPAPNQPALISFDDVTTMFHEFGHGLHGLFANAQYASLSGANTARDFVEFPSQFNEHWALDPLVFKNYAIHYKTHELMPQALVDKIKKAAEFNQGYATTEAVAAAELDLQWHTLPANTNVNDVDKFEAEALKRTQLDLAEVPPRYRSSYFLHIWSNGYAAGYYAYMWTAMLENDAYSWFKEHGGLTRENGQRFRDMILSKGNTENLNKLFLDFRGHEPDIKPLLQNRGLLPTGY
jgi:peptidyl-dipeptidase Dcp